MFLSSGLGMILVLSVVMFLMSVCCWRVLSPLGLFQGCFWQFYVCCLALWGFGRGSDFFGLPRQPLSSGKGCFFFSQALVLQVSRC